jgi:hypothetical protein
MVAASSYWSLVTATEVLDGLEQDLQKDSGGVGRELRRIDGKQHCEYIVRGHGLWPGDVGEESVAQEVGEIGELIPLKQLEIGGKVRTRCSSRCRQSLRSLRVVYEVK